MNLKELIKFGSERLQSEDIEAYDSDAKLLAMHVLDIRYSDLIMKYMDEVSFEDEEKYKELIEKRASHYPCQYITGEQEFMGYTFATSEEVLIPRPETELLVEKAISLADTKKSVSALDMCTGSGCIGISFMRYRKEQGHSDEVTLVDISDYAISLATKNNKLNSTNCNIIKSNLFVEVTGKYDIIMSNPPYIRSADIEELMSDVKVYEPRLALDGMEDGLYFYKAIIKEARNYLHEDGVLLFEIGCDQYEDIRRLLVDNLYEDIELIKDYAGLDRIVKARLGGESCLIN